MPETQKRLAVEEGKGDDALCGEPPLVVMKPGEPPLVVIKPGEPPLVVMKPGEPPLVMMKPGGDDNTSTTTDPPLFVKKGWGWGSRHTVILMACSGVTILSLCRYNLSIAIVSMVKPPHAPHHAHNTTTPMLLDPYYNTTTPLLYDPQGVAGVGVGGGVEYACPVLGNGSKESTLDETDGRFEWDERTQGLVLGAFYYGNVFTNILGGRMAERVGSKPVILLGMFLSSILSLASPYAAHLSANVFIAVRLILGFVQGIVMPAVSRYLASWVPAHKRSKYNSLVCLGWDFGNVVSLSAGGWLCSQTFLGGWPAVFYVFGAVSLVWCLGWAFLVHETPESDPRITPQEKKYLMTHCCVVQQSKVPIPWGMVIRCLPVYAVAIMHIGWNWSYYTFATELPVYLSNIQHFSVESNGMVSALPYMIKAIFSILLSLAMDRATSRGRLSVLSVRRLSTVFACYVPAVALVVMCFVGCNSTAAVVVMCVSIGVSGSAYCGLYCSHQDISPQFAGTLFGLTNSLANMTGFIVPAIVGFITYENQTHSAWNTVFLISAFVNVVGGTFYIVFISAQVQAFNDPSQGKEVEEGAVEKVEEHNIHQLPSSPETCKK